MASWELLKHENSFKVSLASLNKAEQTNTGSFAADSVGTPVGVRDGLPCSVY